jgi:hypothetical protein
MLPTTPTALFQRCASWFCLAFLLLACQKDKEIPDVSHIDVNVKIERADLALMTRKNADEILAYLQAHEQFTLKGLHVNDMAAVKAIEKLSHSPYIDTMMQRVNEVYTPEKINQIEKDLAQLFRHIKYHYPEFHVPDVYAMVSGYGTDLVVRDSLILVGLDFFLGDRHSYYRPPIESFPNYIWRRYDVDVMPAHVARELSQVFNQPDIGENTLMSQMIWAGKAHYFMESVLPNVPDSTLIGYTNQQIVDCEANLPQIWAFFIEKDLFFSMQPFVKRKYIDEAPFISDMSQDAPGRIGQWLGWQIVRAYMENNPQVTLVELMKEQDFLKIFNESRFKAKIK